MFRHSARYRNDEETVRRWQRQFGNNHPFHAVGHSLGGAVADELQRKGLISDQVSFNPAVTFEDWAGNPQRGQRVTRHYRGKDPLYNTLSTLYGDVLYNAPRLPTEGITNIVGDVKLPLTLSEALYEHNDKRFAGGKRKRQ